MKDKNTCVINNCEQNKVTRGLCNRCYVRAIYMIDHDETGKLSWERLVELGLAEPTKNKRGINLFEEALQHKLNEQIINPLIK